MRKKAKLSKKDKWIIAIAIIISISVAVTAVIYTTKVTVSYTHLDVYKRQGSSVVETVYNYKKSSPTWLPIRLSEGNYTSTTISQSGDASKPISVYCNTPYGNALSLIHI